MSRSRFFGLKRPKEVLARGGIIDVLLGLSLVIAVGEVLFALLDKGDICLEGLGKSVTCLECRPPSLLL